MSELKVLGTSVPILRALDELNEYMVEKKRPLFAEIARLARGEIISLQADNERLREELAEVKDELQNCKTSTSKMLELAYNPC